MFLPFGASDGSMFQLYRLSTPSVTIHYQGIYGIWPLVPQQKILLQFFVKKNGVLMNFEDAG